VIFKYKLVRSKYPCLSTSLHDRLRLDTRVATDFSTNDISDTLQQMAVSMLSLSHDRIDAELL
jgi:hypothetical protein